MRIEVTSTESVDVSPTDPIEVRIRHGNRVIEGMPVAAIVTVMTAPSDDKPGSSHSMIAANTKRSVVIAAAVCTMHSLHSAGYFEEALRVFLAELQAKRIRESRTDCNCPKCRARRG